MSNETANMDTKTTNRLGELLDYVHHVGRLNQKPVFTQVIQLTLMAV